jgi:predicted enzyme related to lactoylglutathione lyase
LLGAATAIEVECLSAVTVTYRRSDMSHAVNWFQIQGPNAHVLQQFYKSVFGWKMRARPGSGDSMMVAAEPGGIAGGVGTSHNHQPNVTVYISVGDIDAVVGQIQRGGGRMAMPKMELPGGMGSIAEFTDPAGNTIGLWMPGKKVAAPKPKSTTKKAPATKKKVTAHSAKSPAKKTSARAPAKKADGAKKKR